MPIPSLNPRIKRERKVKNYTINYTIIGDISYPSNPYKPSISNQKLKSEITIIKTTELLTEAMMKEQIKDAFLKLNSNNEVDITDIKVNINGWKMDFN